ncbi:MAG: DUF3566 domain-containing protein [Acidimicrobiales bacterium]
MPPGPQPAVEGGGSPAAGAPPPTDTARTLEGGNGSRGAHYAAAPPAARTRVDPTAAVPGARVAPTPVPAGGAGGNGTVAGGTGLVAPGGVPTMGMPPTGRTVAYAGGAHAAPTTQLPVGPARRVAPGPEEARLERDRDRGPRVVQARRTRRVVRRIDVWTVLKMSVLFYFCVFMVFVVAGVVLWNIGGYFNVITSIEKFIRSLFDLKSFTFNSSVMLEGTVGGGLMLVFLGTVGNVLAALIYNLIADVVGGVQFVVLEEALAPDDLYE